MNQVVWFVDSGLVAIIAPACCKHCVVCPPACGTPDVAVAAVVAALYAEDVTIVKFIKIFMSVVADFAHEDAISVVGG